MLSRGVLANWVNLFLYFDSRFFCIAYILSLWNTCRLAVNTFLMFCFAQYAIPLTAIHRLY